MALGLKIVLLFTGKIKYDNNNSESLQGAKVVQ